MTKKKLLGAAFLLYGGIEILGISSRKCFYNIELQIVCFEELSEARLQNKYKIAIRKIPRIAL